MHAPEAEARRWLDAAREDLAWARYAAGGEYHAPACFHAQQAAEKAVKAIHYARGARAVIGHSVRALIQALDPPETSFDALIDGARELDLLYVPTRYPNGLDAGTPGQAFAAAQSERPVGLGDRFIAAAAGILGM